MPVQSVHEAAWGTVRSVVACACNRAHISVCADIDDNVAMDQNVRTLRVVRIDHCPALHATHGVVTTNI